MKTDFQLRPIIEGFKDSPFYLSNASAINEELNHLEIHELDDYVYNLFTMNAQVEHNKNNSAILYLLGITNVPPVKKITMVGGTKPD